MLYIQLAKKGVSLTPSNDELRIALLMAEKFGYKVQLVPRVLIPRGIKTPDYIINGERFDLKSIHSDNKRALDNAVNKKKEQSSNFIFDTTESTLSAQEIEQQAEAIYRNPFRSYVDKIVLVNNGKVVKVLKRKQ